MDLSWGGLFQPDILSVNTIPGTRANWTCRQAGRQAGESTFHQCGDFLVPVSLSNWTRHSFGRSVPGVFEGVCLPLQRRLFCFRADAALPIRRRQ